MINSGLFSKIMATGLLLLVQISASVAGDVTVAVASNFRDTAQKIAEQFNLETGHSVNLVNGSTGMLFAQISKGAPYDVFLSADKARVVRLSEAGKLLDGSHKPYAFGKLVLFARDSQNLAADIKSSLYADTTLHFAIADAASAPYGLAAEQVLTRLDLLDVAKDKAVVGTNIGQTFGFVATGNAAVGFVALSQAKQRDGKWLEISPDLYDPIVQQAGLLARSAGNDAAAEFYRFLCSKTARKIVQDAGYGVPK